GQSRFGETVPESKEVGQWFAELARGHLKLEMLRPGVTQPQGVFAQTLYRLELTGSLAGFERWLDRIQASHFKPEIRHLEIKQVSAGIYRFSMEMNVISALIPTKASLYPVRQTRTLLTPQQVLPVLQGFWHGDQPR